MKTRKGLGVVFVIAALLCACTASWGQLMSGGWPKFRGDARNTAQASSVGPSQAALDWTFTTGAAVSSSPAIGPDGTVYFVSQDQKIYALNPNGTQKWQRLLGLTNSSSPAVASDGTIYVGADNFYLYAINPDGTIKWMKGLYKQIRSSPAIASDGTVYAGVMNGKVHAVLPSSAPKWEYQTGNPVTSSPAIGSDGTVYIGSEDQYLYAIKPDGTLRWRYYTSGWIDSSPAVAAGGTIYAGTSDGRLIAINPDGTLSWSYRIGFNVRSSPAVASDGTIYVGADDNYMYAFNPNGTLKWRYRVGDKVQSSPAIGADGTIYFGSFDNNIYALSPAGDLIWQYATGGQIYGSPAIGPDGALYVGSYDKKLYAFSRDRTPPTTPVVTDDGAFTTDPTQLHASWTTSDPETGIIDIRYGIGTTPGATDVVDWTSVGTAGSVTRSGLPLVNGVTYYIAVKSQNDAHQWSVVGVSDGIRLDTTPPTLPIVTDEGDFTSSGTTLQASWSATDPESGIVEYQYGIGTTSGGTNIVGWTSAGTGASVTRNDLTLAQNLSYYISVRARDGAGFWSSVGTSNGIAVDRTAPPAPVVSDDGVYSPTNTSLRATWTGTDPESGVGEYQYAIGTTPGATNTADWTSSGTSNQVTRSGLSLVDGATYYVSVRTRNRAGILGAAGTSDGIIIDTSAPTVPSVTDDGQYSSSANMLHATWSATDPHTAVGEYQYGIGTSSGATDVLGWTSTGVATQVTNSALALVSGSTYYFSVKAKNMAGVWSAAGVSDGIKVDLTSPTAPVVFDDGQFSANNTTIHATWSATDPESGVIDYQYSIGTTLGGANVVPWTSAGAGLSITKTGLSLSDGVTYYVSVKARNRVDMWSSVGSTDGITVDASAPPAPTVTDDGNFSATASSLHATWTASDPHSGVVEYQYAIGSAPGATNITGWTSVGTASEVTKTGLLLTHGSTYYISIKAKSGSGLWSVVGTSDGITVDLTAPSAPSVTDDGQYTADNTRLHAAWTAYDPESGVAEYQYAIGTTPGGSTIVGWTNTGGTSEVNRTGLALSSGVKYYISVKARNGAGTWGNLGVSDGITVDTTAPSSPSVTDDGQYTTTATSLHAVWTASDTESGIGEYQYALGTAPGASDLVAWTSTGNDAFVTRTGLALVDGVTYYFAVKAKNRAGLWSNTGTSDGIIVDTSAPSLPVVSDDGFTSLITALHATWSSDDPHTGIAQYQYAIGTTPGGTNVVNWTNSGTVTEITRSGLMLAHGAVYYFSVKSKNAAGLWSGVGTSVGVLVDTTAPVQPTVTDDGDYTSSPVLHASWTASDPESGVLDYQYAIGTARGAGDVVAWTNTGSANEITRSDLTLVNGVRYYFAVRARNRAGAWSSIGTSDGVMVDTTAPPAPLVADDGQYTTANTSLHAAWNAIDPESGVGEYLYAIGVAPGDASVVDWTSTGSATSITRTSLALSDGTTYYFSVKARNRAGLTSLIGTSDGIIVDGSAPAAPLVTDDAFTDSTNSLHATWTADDPHSGIADYQYAIGTTPGGTNIVAWTSAGTLNEITRTGLTLFQGATYFFTVKAKNRAGSWSTVGTSSGVLVDTTPPPAPLVVDDGLYTQVGTSLHATWNDADPESGIFDYQYAVGTTPGATNIVGWTSAGSATQAVIPGAYANGSAYYISVRARNRVGRFGAVGTTDGIIVDSTPPSTPVVIDDGALALVLDSLHATWSASDPHTGVTEYQYAIGSTPGASNVVAWTSVGTATEVTKNGLALSHGAIYFFSVKAKNAAGGWSSVGSSDGITTDGTPPLTPVVTVDARYTSNLSSLHASWSATDPESGVEEYQYAIGTTPGGAETVAWTSAGAATEVTRTGLALSEGITYYFAVKARNRALLWSAVGVSTPVTVDTSGPTVSAVNDDGDYTLSLDTLHASWAAFDAQSGIVEYQYCVGTTAGAADIATWSSAGSVAEITRGGLSLTDGGTYFFAVRAKNGAGLWGGVGVSDGITVAISAAWPKFRGGAQNQGVSRFFGSRVGALLWQFQTAGWVESSPALSGDGTVYIGSGDGSIYAISRTGSLLWKYTTGGSIDSSPAIARDGSIYVGSYDGYLYCLSGGTCRWKFKTADMIWSSPVIGSDDTVYFGSQDSYIYALHPDGTLKWKRSIGATVWSSPALADDGSLYFGGGDGYIYALNSVDGSIKWRFETGTAVDSSPAIGPDGTVFMGSGDGYFYALNPNGTLKWTFDTGGWAVDSSAAVAADGTVYVGCGHDWSYGMLYAINPNGTMKWAFDAHGEVRSSPAISSEGIIYVGSGDGNIYAINPDGTTRWSYNTGWAVLSSPAIGRDGRVVIGSYSSYVFTFKDTTIDDTTAPTRPTVVDEGVVTTSTTALTGAWTANDPESGVTEYKYAIGTWPGTDDVVGWTSVGTQTSVTRTDLALGAGVTYYFSVKAMNPARMWSAVGVSDGIQVSTGGSSVDISAAKHLPDQSGLTISGKIVTARFDGSFYVEEPDRSGGLKVLTEGMSSPAEGTRVSLAGAMTTDNGERALRLSTLAPAENVPVPASIGMSNASLGGSSQNSFAASVKGGTGLNNIGLLVTIWGRVTAAAPTNFQVDDGSGALDPTGLPGVKVTLTGLFPGTTMTPPSVGSYVRVTGISSIEPAAPDHRRLLRPRSQGDVVISQ